MLNTISDCNKEMRRLDAELARLNLERNHVLAVMDLLLQTKPKTDTDRSHLPDEKKDLIDIIKDNPGIDARKIFALLPELRNPGNRRTLTWRLSDLKRAGYIENRGTHGMGARWYIKED